MAAQSPLLPYTYLTYTILYLPNLTCVSTLETFWRHFTVFNSPTLFCTILTLPILTLPGLPNGIPADTAINACFGTHRHCKYVVIQ